MMAKIPSFEEHYIPARICGELRIAARDYDHEPEWKAILMHAANLIQKAYVELPCPPNVSYKPVTKENSHVQDQNDQG